MNKQDLNEALDTLLSFGGAFRSAGGDFLGVLAGNPSLRDFLAICAVNNLRLMYVGKPEER